jgi:DNA repair protein RecO (recombination protein O)
MKRAGRVTLACGHLLHQLPWRDSSLMVELYTREHGRLRAFAHAARGPRSRFAVLQPFRPLLLSWSGRGDAPTLAAAEPDGPPPAAIPPARLMGAFYVNELLLRLTMAHDPQPDLYDHYVAGLDALRADLPQEQVLRHFERRLLDLTGYGLDLECDTAGRAIEAAAYYHFEPGAGLVRDADGGIAGLAVQALAAGAAFAATDHERQVRRLLRVAIDHCLEGRPLATRAVARELAARERATT